MDKDQSQHVHYVRTSKEVFHLQLLQQHGGLLPGPEVLRHGEVGGTGGC